ncbi:MAG: hypothetical protein U9Q84_04735 [Thermodesulfobacteriota bacterium]|nr:hypothetical protein [Thermodesulfobacteriota bacterium]
MREAVSAGQRLVYYLVPCRPHNHQGFQALSAAAWIRKLAGELAVGKEAEDEREEERRQGVILISAKTETLDNKKSGLSHLLI